MRRNIMKKRILAIGLTLCMIAGMVLTGCGGSSGGSSGGGDGKVVKLGFLSPITGANAAEGAAARNAFKLAIDQANESGDFDYTIESDHQDWVPSSEKSSEWLVRDSKWSSVAFRCGIRIHAELKYDASVTLNQRSYSNSGSFTVPENTANLWLELMIQGADYEAQGPGGYDFTPSFSHLVGVHIALKIKSLEDGKPLSETTTEASGFSGEDEGTNIPWIYIVGGSAAVLGLLGVV